MSDDPETGTESKGEGVAQSQYKAPSPITTTAVTKANPTAVVAHAVRKDEAEAQVRERGIARTDMEESLYSCTSSAGRGSDSRWRLTAGIRITLQEMSPSHVANVL
ncbi:hypothetical protein H2202_003717 [Exophiala xenobiotica]|nr:hypothetical protein H2202_003717 [Exophiala xenobiotica]